MRNFIVTIDGKSYSVAVEETTEGGAVVPQATPKEQQTAAPAPKAQPAATTAAKGEKVLSPFPGLIKNILVENGASVKKDQPIVVLEAMKMDNDITAPCDGTVTISVNKGANVETGAVLAIIS